ncbi:MAG: hypothetical protein J7L39_01125 [Candidatus Aenigmarchaeota archaeon]|nr:hypothetical protein [Candidatus Aenigmarchaeota archaeon]
MGKMKGISGKILGFIISLILVLIALAIIFGLLNFMKPLIVNTLNNILGALKEKLICSMLGWLRSLLPFCW